MVPQLAALDDPVRAALEGPHAGLAVSRGRIVRYRPDVAPFTAVPADAGPEDWEDARALAGDGPILLLRPREPAPAGWRVAWELECVQMTCGPRIGMPDGELLALADPDVPEMLALTKLTNPGPFLDRTIDFGGYLGMRDGPALVAMAGERMRVPGWAEVSAVCTAPTHRGRGLATRLVRAVAAGIERRGDGVFLHAVATNTGAIRLYETLGFTIRTHVVATALEPE